MLWLFFVVVVVITEARHHHHHNNNNNNNDSWEEQQQQQQKEIQAIRVKFHSVDDSPRTPIVSHGAAGFLERRLYVVGGAGQTDVVSNNVSVFDPVKDQWKQLESPSDVVVPEVSGAAAAVCSNRLYVFGGKEDATKATNKLSIFDSERAIWSQVDSGSRGPPPVFGHTMVSVMHKYSRALKSKSLLNRKDLLEEEALVSRETIASLQSNQFMNSWIETSSTTTTKLTREEEHSRRHNCDIFLIGGRQDGWLGLLNDQIWRFDTVTRGWEGVKHPQGESPSSRTNHVSAAVGSQILVYGGDAGGMVSANSNECWIFDTVESIWNRCPARGAQPPALVGAAAVSVNKIVYIFGGYDGRHVRQDLFAYSLKEYRWIEVQPDTPNDFRPTARAFHCLLATRFQPILRALHGHAEESSDSDELSQAIDDLEDDMVSRNNFQNFEIHGWQGMLADDSPSHIVFVVGGSGFPSEPIFADTWALELLPLV